MIAFGGLFSIKSWSEALKKETWPRRGADFRGLVLGCIDADFYNQILILQHFSRSIRFARLCTAPFQVFHNFSFLQQNFSENSGFCKTLLENDENLLFLIDIFTDFSRNRGKFQLIAGGRCIFQNFPKKRKILRKKMLILSEIG